MSEVKRCIQCGLLKELDEFRRYTYSKANDTEGRYRICRTCEKINARYNSICKEPTRWIEERKEIEQLYAKLRSLGLKVPNNEEDAGQKSAVGMLLDFYADAPIPVPAKPIEPIVIDDDTPSELQYWIDTDPAEWIAQGLSPEFLQETVYESLKTKYRPQTGIDKERFIPVYDDTYKDILNAILKKFDDYEESYEEEEADV